MPQKFSDGARALKAFIKKHNLSQATAGDAIGVSDPCVHDWVSGAKRPRPHHRAAIEVWTSGEVRSDSWLLDGEAAGLSNVKPFVPDTDSASTLPDVNAAESGDTLPADRPSKTGT